MMWICNRCGETFAEPDIKSWYESRGEFWGDPAYERVSEEICPFCGSSNIDEDLSEYEEEEELDYEEIAGEIDEELPF